MFILQNGQTSGLGNLVGERQVSNTNQMIDGESIATTNQRISCNGGGGALGHPQVWLTLGTDGVVTCPYCSRRYVFADTEDDA